MSGVGLKCRRDGPTSSRVSSHLALDPWRREGPDRSWVALRPAVQVERARGLCHPAAVLRSLWAPG